MRVGTNTNCGGHPRATKRSMAAMAAAKLDPGRTRSRVTAVAPSTQICTHCTASSASRVAALSTDAATVGFDLERDLPLGQEFEQIPAMLQAERLAAAKGHVRDPEIGYAPR